MERKVLLWLMCLWCWNASPKVTSDDMPSQRRGQRGVLSLFFKVRMHQGRVTFPAKFLSGVRATNTSSRLPRVRPEYSWSIRQSNLLFQASYSRDKNHWRLLVHLMENLSISRNLSWAWHLRIFFVKPFHLFLGVLHTLEWFPSSLILCATFPLHKIRMLFYLLVPSANL